MAKGQRRHEQANLISDDKPVIVEEGPAEEEVVAEEAAEEEAEEVAPEPQPEPPVRQGVGLEEPDLPDAWRGIESAPLDGTQIEVAVDTKGTPVRAYWRQTRQLHHYKWKKEGRWTNPLNNSNIDFFPTVWRAIRKDNIGEVVAAAKAESEHGSEAA